MEKDFVPKSFDGLLESVTKEIKKCLESPLLSEKYKIDVKAYVKEWGDDVVLMCDVLNRLHIKIEEVEKFKQRGMRQWKKKK